MTPERWEQITELYHEARELPAADRPAFLERVCGEDEDLYREVETLLAADQEAGGFINEPALRALGEMQTLDEMPTLLGQQVGHYQIIASLGSGGMGRVYRAYDSRLGREVAIKSLPSAFAADASRLRRFRNEAQAAATLNHPSIATIYSVEEIEGHHFITMEYVEGKTLDRVTPPSGLDVASFSTMFLSLADALAHAHAKGVVHRDIKPSNIMITPTGLPKILDFGVARITRPEHEADSPPLNLTREGQILGTPAYMSPEQAEGKSVDHRSDIFSFGVVMYEALTGKRPFRGDNYAALVGSLLREEPAPIDELKPEAPPALTRLIRRCLKKEWGARYQSMAEVRAVLEEIREQSPNLIRITESDQLKATQPLPIRRRLGWWALTLILASIFAALYYWNRARPAEVRPVTRFSITGVSGLGSDLTLTRFSPDGRQVLVLAGVDASRQIFLRSLDKFEYRELTSGDGVRSAFFSRDSRWVGYFTDDGKLKKIPVAGGSPLTMCESCPLANSADWGPDGTIIAASDSGLFRVRPDAGTSTILTTVNEAAGEVAHRWPHVLPDGKNLLFTVQTLKGSRLAVLPLTGGKYRLLDQLGEASSGQYLPSGQLIFARSRQLMAVPFDLSRLDAAGISSVVLDGLYVFPNFKVADDGTLFYLPESPMRENTLVWVDREGESVPLLEKRADYRNPRLSPDGRRVALQVGSDIWVYEVGSGRGIRLTFEGDNQFPIWSLDGRRILYATNYQGTWALNGRSADGSGDAIRIYSGDYRIFPFSWHPSGLTLAVGATYSPSNADVLMLSIRDGQVTPFVNTPFIDDGPRFSPDGRFVTWFSMETGHVEIYAQPYPGQGGRKPVTQGGGMFPVWSPDAKEIYYRNGNKLYAVPVTTIPELSFGAPKLLFEGRYLTGYDLSPDGKRFLMVRNEQGTLPGQLNIILNWTSELQRLLAPAE